MTTRARDRGGARERSSGRGVLTYSVGFHKLLFFPFVHVHTLKLASLRQPPSSSVFRPSRALPTAGSRPSRLPSAAISPAAASRPTATLRGIVAWTCPMRFRTIRAPERCALPRLGHRPACRACIECAAGAAAASTAPLCEALADGIRRADSDEASRRTLQQRRSGLAPRYLLFPPPSVCREPCDSISAC